LSTCNFPKGWVLKLDFDVEERSSNTPQQTWKVAFSMGQWSFFPP